MATEEEVREALGTTLDAIDGLRGHGYTPGQVHGPAAVVIEVDISFDTTMGRGTDTFTCTVRLLVGGDHRSAQLSLSDYVSKVRDHIWDNSDLGGIAQDSRVARKRGDTEGQVNVAGATFTVADLEIEVIA